jgi:hypothetical protein
MKTATPAAAEALKDDKRSAVMATVTAASRQ